MALDVEIGRPASFVGQPQAYVSIRDTIRTCAKGVAEGFALQAFAQMPTGQGWVGLFLLFNPTYVLIKPPYSFFNT